jgi:hypothetical protein
MLVMFW